MSLFDHSGSEEVRLLRRIKDLLEQLVDNVVPHLTEIQIVFQTGDNMATGAVTLNIGQTTVASVAGFDQFGNPFSPVPTPTWAIDQPSLDSIVSDPTTPANEDVTSLAPGTANLSAAVAGSNGTLTATAVITNVAVTPTPVLTTIAIEFSTPATPAVKK